ncbi:DUF2073 domain-containing protein [Candidatus Woesearchaeota archaeon]|nr:DUF2073 domain-containing protein [Candidatus Woesearchaeota archaeon]
MMVTLQILPYSEIEHLASLSRIRKILNIAKENKIVLIQGRLKKEEEAELIKTTMEEIDKDFQGIELAVIYPRESKEEGMISNIKNTLINTLLGDRQGLTIVGPASIVKQIKKDPKKIELLTTEKRSISKPKSKPGSAKKRK